MEMFLSWMNDAYAMEVAAGDLSKRYSDDVEKYPELQAKFRDMAKRSESKAEQLKGMIDTLGGDTSKAKTAIGKLGSMYQSAMSELMHDQVVKHMLVSYSGASLGIASYHSLAAAAKELGHTEVVSFAEECMTASKEFCSWLEKEIPKTTVQFLKEEHT